MTPPPGSLTVIDPAGDDALDFIAALEAEGVGAKIGEATEDDGVEILIHEPEGGHRRHAPPAATRHTCETRGRGGLRV